MVVWFVGEGPFAALCLERLNRLIRPLEGWALTQIITGLPTRSGRGMKETPSPVEVYAAGVGLPVKRTGRLSQNGELLDALRSSPPDVIFVIDFGQIIREPFLSAPRWGCLNIHPSLLPRWRGAAPIQRALLNGDPETGVTVFRLVPEMDAGPVLCQAAVPVGPDAAASELYKTLSVLGADIAVEGLGELLAGKRGFTEQDHASATIAAKLAREEFEAAWDWTAFRIHNAARALDTSGGAFVVLKDGGRLKLWRTALSDAPEGTPGTVLSLDPEGPVVSCGAGALRLLEVQAPGKRRMRASEWARGLRISTGDRLI